MTAWLTSPSGPPAARVSALNALLPVLETDRLVLRPCRIDDWPRLEPIWTSDRAQFIDGPMNAQDAWLDFNQCMASWLLRGVGPLTITLKGDDNALGLVLLGTEYGDPSPELGWLLTEDAEGNGYATEAAAALRDWGFKELADFNSFVDKQNIASIRVAERLGATVTGNHPASGNVHVYSYSKGAAQ